MTRAEPRARDGRTESLKVMVDEVIEELGPGARPKIEPE